jgi:hypothetical protein
MAYIPPNPNGQATSANSAPVVLASDQSVLTAKVSDGTNNAGVFVPGTPNSTANAVVVAGTSESHAFNVSAVQTGTTYDVGNCAWVSVQILTQYTGTTPTITFQTSNDGTNWVACTLENTTSTTGAGVTGTSTAGNSYQGPLPGRYFRLNFTGAYTSGTTTGTISFFTTARSLHSIGAAVVGTQTPADGANGASGLNVYADNAVFNGTTWDRQRSAASAAGTTGTGVVATGAMGFDGTNFQRLKTDTSGNVNALISDGTNTANILKNDGTAAGQNAQLVGRAYLSVAFTTTTVQAVGTTDGGGYASVSVQIASQGTSSTVTWQGSNDNVNWYGIGLLSSGAVGGTPLVSSSTTTNTYVGPLNFRYFRLNVTGISAGTTAGTVMFFTTPYSNNTNTIQVSSNNTTGSAVPSTAFYMGINSGSSLSGAAAMAVLTDGITATSVLATGVIAHNGTTYDRQRNNTTGAVIAAGTTASNAGVSVTTYNASKAVIVVSISAFTSGSLTVAISGATSSGYSYPILTSTALAAVAVTPLRIFPGATASANAVANDMVPRTIQVVTTVSGTLTYGVDYELSV